jgi:acyl carrier protein
MTRSQIQSKVRSIICDQLSLTADQLADTTHLENDLKADSLDITDLGMSLEDEFQITIEDSALARIKTFGDAVNHICEIKGIPPDAAGHEPAKNWPPAYAPAVFSPAPAPAPLARDCKSCGAHSVSEKICPYCGRAAH